MKLNIKAFALTCGLIWGLGFFAMTWWLIAAHGGPDIASFFGLFYYGYTVTPLGSVIGLGWAFADGLIGGAVFAGLYNLFARDPRETG